MNETTTTTNAIFNTPELAKKADIMLQAYSSGLYDVNQITARAIFDGMNKDQVQFIRNEIAKNDAWRAELARKIKEEYDNRPEQEKESFRMLEKATNFLKSFFSKWPHPLPLIPGLTDEAAEMKVYSPEKARAELVCNQLPAIIHNIQIISERGKSGYEFLKEYGEIFNTTEKQYFPTWGVRYFSNLIREETSRRLFFYTSLYGDAPKADGENALPENELEEIRQLRKNAISELRKFPETLKAFYSSTYHQAYTIAQAVPVTYQQKESDVYTIRELGILYFLATFDVMPDADASEITENKKCYIKDIVSKIDRFFCTYASKEDTGYDLFIDFLYNEITHNIPELSGLITKPGHSYFPINTEYNYIPNFQKYENDIPGFSSEIAERFLLECYPYYEKSQLLGFTPDIIISIRSPELIENILGKQKGNAITTIDNETGKKWEKGEKAQEWRDQIIPTINALKTIYEPISAKTTTNKYLMLSACGIHEDTGIVDFQSRWIIERSKAIHAAAKKSKQKDVNTGKPKEINPFITIIRNITKETPLVRELTAAILSEAMKGVRFKKCSYNPARLIREKCPRLYAAINEKPTSKEKTLLLKRVYERFYKILEMPQKIAFYDYFLPITQDENGNKIDHIAPYFVMINAKTGKTEKAIEKLKTVTKTITSKDETGQKVTVKEKEQVITRVNPYPTFKIWGDVTITLYHGGKNPKYLKPI